MASLIELLTIGIGTGIAKGVLKLWLQDNEIAQEVGSNIIDIIKNKTKDHLAIRKANRDFEELSEKVATHLLPMFELESENIETDRLVLIATCAGKILDSVAITPKILANQNLDPKTLSNHFLDSFQDYKQKDFNDRELKFFKEVIFESCSFMVDISSQLPGFTEKTFSEVLKRENLILSQVNLILEELKRIEKKSNSQNEEIKYEKEYLRSIVRRFDKIELFGVDLSATTKRYKLSVAYVSLTTKIKNSENNKIGIEQENEIIHINDLLNEKGNIIIRGIAGSGKTTLLKWILVQTASRNFTGSLNELNGKIPFFIRLREFADIQLPSPEDFVKINAPAIAAEMPDKWCNKLLRSGRAVVLIDGLDELQQNRRNDVKEWIEQFVNSYPSSIYFLSTRPYAAKEGWLSNLSFIDAEIQNLKNDDIKNFVDHWHSAIMEGLHDKNEIEELIQYREYLKETIKNVWQIRKLATNPLLCSLICALHKERIRKLPYDRIELYRACTDMFFRRDLERKVILKDYPKLTERQKRRLIIDLAYWLLKNGWSDIEIEQCDKRFGRKIPNMERISSETKGSDIRRYFVERSGILRMPTVNKIDFPHRTFQEYFAAQAVLDEEDLGLLIENADNDLWHEVIILTSGLARKKEAKLIIEALIKSGNIEIERRYRSFLLAASCLDVCVEIPSVTKKLVEKSIKKILPPCSIAQAVEIAKTGELVVPFLKYRYSLSVRKMSSCIRALTLIGTPQAFDQLENYLVDKRRGLKDALLYSSKHTQDPIDFGKRFFTKFDKIRMVGQYSLELFLHCTQLKELNLDIDYVQRTDLSPLKNLKKLISLKLAYGRQQRILDFSGLNELTALKYLDLSNTTDFNDLIDIIELENLETLVLHNIYIESFELLRKLKRLKYLRYTFTYSKSLNSKLNLTDLIKCPNLKKVVLDKEIVSKIRNIDQLEFEVTSIEKEENRYKFQI